MNNTEIYSEIGNKYDHLTIISFDHKNKKGDLYFKCKCDCGSSKEIIIRLATLKDTVYSHSCGCTRAKKNKIARTTHGQSNKRIFTLYYDMLARCYNPKSKDYHRYGAKGIDVYHKWRDSFEEYYNWSMEHGYTDDLTLDRLNGDIGYYPWNCRWATDSEQNLNKKGVLLIEFKGQNIPLRILCNIYDLNYGRIRKRKIKQTVDELLIERYGSLDNVPEVEEWIDKYHLYNEDPNKDLYPYKFVTNNEYFNNRDNYLNSLLETPINKVENATSEKRDRYLENLKRQLGLE